MFQKRKVYSDMYQELLAYEKEGIEMRMEGELASPMQILTAHLVQEEQTYMRDYVLDEEGKITALCFHALS